MALVLGGGGIAGYSFHTASLGAIQEVTGWDPRTADLVIGTSAGSSIGALIAGRVSVADMLARILTVPTDPAGMAKLRSISGRGLSAPFLFGLTGPRMALREVTRFPKVDPLRLVTGLLPQGAVQTEILGEDAEVLHGDTWPAQPLWITAVDTSSGARVVFGRDRFDVPVHQAVEASCAVPALFQPVGIDGDTFVDGGVESATNADLVLESDGAGAPDCDFDLVVILSPLSERRKLRMPSANSVLRVLPTIQLHREVGTIRKTGTPVLIIEPNGAVVRATGPNPMDPTKLISVMVESSTSAFDTLAKPALEGHVELLTQCAAATETPPDVPFPQPQTTQIRP